MDSILITMPKDFYRFLQAMAVSQDYSIQLAVGAQKEQRDPNYQITFRMDEKYQYLEPCLRVVQNNIPTYDYTGWEEEQRSEYDCFINFNDMFERAKKFSININQHITAGLNTLIGAGAQPLPVIAPLQLKQDNSCDILLIGWDAVESLKFYEFLFNNYPQLDIVHDERSLDKYSVEETFEYINHFKCVIGPAGVGTYLATILKKTVLELYPTELEARLYGFQGYPKYNAIVGQKHSAEFVWTIWERDICREFLQDMNFHAEQISKVTQESIVVNVEEKSCDNQTLKSGV